MTVAYYLIVALHVVACLFLIGVVLLQQGKSQDLASAFGGSSQTAFGPRGSATVLSKATTVLAGVFMLTSLSLTMLRPRGSSILDQPAVAASPAPAAPVVPGLPAASQAPATTMAPGATLPAAPAASPAAQ